MQIFKEKIESFSFLKVRWEHVSLSPSSALVVYYYFKFESNDKYFNQSRI